MDMRMLIRRPSRRTLTDLAAWIFAPLTQCCYNGPAYSVSLFEISIRLRDNESEYQLASLKKGLPVFFMRVLTLRAIAQ